MTTVVSSTIATAGRAPDQLTERRRAAHTMAHAASRQAKGTTGTMYRTNAY